MPNRSIIAALILLLPLGAARADGEILNIITKHDKARLDDFEATKKEAVQEAGAGDPAQFAVLKEVLAHPKQDFSGFDMTGDWQCRTIKAGGIASVVVYGWFKCRVTDDGSGWQLTKLSGSQRTKGRFFTDSDTRLTYLGSYFVAGDAPPVYGAGPESDQAGYAFRSGTDRWRIEFPAPERESKLDVLEFRR